MKYIVLFFSVLFLISCQQANSKKEQPAASNTVAELKEAELSIGRMHCEMCVASIEKGLKSVEGVEYVKVSLADSTAVVRFDDEKADINKFREVIEKRGYLLKDSDL